MTHFPFGTVSAATAAYLLEQSLLFDGAAYLSRTSAGAGNRKTWTYSVWCKLSSPEGATQWILGVSQTGTPSNGLVYGNGITGTLRFYYYYNGSSWEGDIRTSAVFRDPSAWYHVVIVADMTNATSSDRMRMYVNGTRITSFSPETYPAQNTDGEIGNAAQYNIGSQTDGGNYFSGLMALPILVDGAALDATSFGEEDADGYWNPIAYVTGAEPAAIGATWRGSYSSDSDAASYTNSGAALGTADADRYVIVAIPLFTGPTNLTISSVTIGGVSATKINGETFHSATSTNRSLVDFWKANVPTGTTGDIVITPSTTAPRMSASWWTCIGDVAIIDTQADIATDVTPDNSLTVTSKRPSNGFVLAAITGQGDSGDPTFTWGGTGITEKHETGYGDTDGAHGSASGDFTAASTEAITVTNGLGDMYYYILSAVTFAPPGGDGAYGTNGGAYDFADTADFGKDVNYTGDTSVTFTDSSVNSGSATTYTFSSQAIGTASADRVVVVGTSGGAGNTNPVSSMTIGGVSAVKAIGIVNSTGTEIWYATVTSGTTASVVVNWGAAKNRCGIGVWALTGVTGVGATNTSTSSTATLTVSGRTKDIVLAVYGGKDHASVTFTGLTEDYDEDISGAGSQYQAGGSKKLTATGSNTITVTPNTGATEVAAVSAVFLATGNNGYFSNNFTASDQLSDTPTDSADDEIGNFATFNPNLNNPFSGGMTNLSNANLTSTSDGANQGMIGSLYAVDDGVSKYVWEFTVGTQQSGDTLGVIDDVTSATAGGGNKQYTAAGTFNGTSTGSPASWTSNDIIRCEVDFSAAYEIEWFKNNVSQGTQQLGVADRAWSFAHFAGASGSVVTVNAGQSVFAHTPTSGFKSLATQNLPAPTIADGSDYFNTVLYTGDGTSPRKITTGFTPELIWIKNRTDVAGHQLFDIQRDSGTEPYLLASNSTAAETVTGRYLASLASSAFDTDGFNISSDGNVSAKNYVAWCWKAGGTAVTNTDGTITSSVSANPTAGFSIVTWTGTGVAATVGHGLGVPNDFMIFKSRSNVSSPGVVTSALGFTKDLLLETTDAAYTRAAISNNTAPTSTVFSVGTDTAINVSGYTYVAYCWAEVEGFSKFGSYTGNGSAAGPFIYTGFRPAFVIIKKSSAAGTTWNMFDNKRDPFNLVIQALWANASDAEAIHILALISFQTDFVLSAIPPN
jgi:hypothetical protein